MGLRPTQSLAWMICARRIGTEYRSRARHPIRIYGISQQNIRLSRSACRPSSAADPYPMTNKPSVKLPHTYPVQKEARILRTSSMTMLRIESGKFVPESAECRKLPNVATEQTSCRFYTAGSHPDDTLQETPHGLGAAEVAARGWQITEENESDWRGHAAAIARSIQLMKTRMEWTTMLSRLQQLDVELASPDLWDDPAAASKLSRERGGVAGRVEAVREMESELVEQIEMAELAREEKDTQIEGEAREALAALRKLAKERELAALLCEEHDENSCYLEVQAGAGGVESMDWAAMILRMYKMWAVNRGYEVVSIEEMHGEEAGIKRGTIRIDGQFAYGYAKSEAGVHRLVRISPFDAGKRRHTSFAAVAVMPVLDESAIKIQIDEADLEIERFRAGGPGGQHVNKTESAVRIFHLPSGITVQCQADRSQHRNKATALAMLQSRLYQIETTRRAQATAQHTQTLGDITWGNQIRSYVLQPYQMVKDVRTGYEESDPLNVLNGDLDSFILNHLAKQAQDSSHKSRKQQ